MYSNDSGLKSKQNISTELMPRIKLRRIFAKHFDEEWSEYRILVSFVFERLFLLLELVEQWVNVHPGVFWNLQPRCFFFDPFSGPRDSLHKSSKGYTFERHLLLLSFDFWHFESIPYEDLLTFKPYTLPIFVLSSFERESDGISLVGSEALISRIIHFFFLHLHCN